jgi:hypothetical protein
MKSLAAYQQNGLVNYNSGIQKEQVCFTGGCVVVPVVDQGVVETVGVNGGKLTTDLSVVLAQIAFTLRQDPNADQTLADLLTNLANQGHTVGSTADELISACTSDCASADPVLSRLQSGTQTFDGQYSSVKQYLASHPNALPAELRGIVDVESQSVLALAKGFDINRQVIPGRTTQQEDRTIVGWTPMPWQECNARGINCYRGQAPIYSSGTITPEVRTTREPDRVSRSLKASAPDLIHQDSNTICGSGGRTRSCLFKKKITL